MLARSLIASFFASFLISVAYSDKNCPKRTDYDSRCKKPCNKDSDCRRQKICVCDGVCGMSCAKRGTKCGDDYYKKPSRGKIKINGKNLGDKILYKCNRGYTLYGPRILTCSAIGKWKPWDQGTPTCKRVCPNPGNPKDGRLIGNKFEIGSRIRFLCNPGYDLQGATVAVCRRDLTWSSAVPICRTKSCSKPDLPRHSELWRGEKSLYIFGDRIMMRCKAGYFGAGRNLFICGLNGWSKSNYRCLPKSCGDPGTPDNGIRIGELFTFREIVRYKCRQGYKLHGVSSRQCLENQKWRRHLPKCELIDCGAAPVLKNGRYSGSSTYYGETQTAECDIGYQLVGSGTTKCGVDGWSFDGQKPTCKDRPKNCFDVKEIANGQLVKHVVDHGETVEYRCNNGYHIDSTPWQKCENGRVTGTQPSCVKDKPKDCSNIQQIANGDMNDYTVKHDSRVDYYCSSGYTLVGRKPRCDNGEIKGRIPYCKKDTPKDCFNIPSIQHGNKIDSNVKHGARAGYVCDYGYELIGKNPKCKNGVLKGAIPYCSWVRSKDCTNIDEIPNGVLVHKPVRHGAVIQYRCASGYSMHSKPLQKCDDGIVTGEYPTCKQIPGYQGCFTSMGNYQLGVKGGSIEECKKKCRDNWKDYIALTYNRKYPCICNDKFYNKVSDSECSSPCDFDKSYSCGRYGKYSVYRTDLVCPELDVPYNGKISSSNVEVGTLVTFSCDENYQLLGRASLVCTDKGQWSHKQPKCIKKEKNCPRLIVPENTYISSYDVKVGAKVRFTCKNSFYIQGNDTVTCSSEGKWPSEIPHCIERGSLQERYLGCYIDDWIRALRKYEGIWDKGQSFTERCIRSCGRVAGNKYAGLQYTYQCFCGSDYDKHGKANEDSCNMLCKGHLTRKCGGPLRNSVYKTGCPKPADPENGQSVGNWYEPNTRASYKCQNGFTLKGRGQLCDGYEWIQAIPKCVEMTTKVKPAKGADCPSTFNDKNLQISASNQKHGTLAIFRCKGSFILDGDYVSTCRDGQWSGTRRCFNKKT